MQGGPQRLPSTEPQKRRADRGQPGIALGSLVGTSQAAAPTQNAGPSWKTPEPLPRLGDWVPLAWPKNRLKVPSSYGAPDFRAPNPILKARVGLTRKPKAPCGTGKWLHWGVLGVHQKYAADLHGTSQQPSYSPLVSCLFSLKQASKQENHESSV